MANLAQAMKEEIQRIAQREVRREMNQPKKQQSQHRRDIAALKRRISELEKRLATLENHQQKQLSSKQSQIDAVMSALSRQPGPGAAPPKAKATGSRTRRASGPRFQPRGLRTHRNKLGLTAEEYGQLVGVSGQSIYAWENERSRPRAKQTEALAAVRKLGKRQARDQLEQAQNQSSQSSRNKHTAETERVSASHGANKDNDGEHS